MFFTYFVIIITKINQINITYCTRFVGQNHVVENYVENKSHTQLVRLEFQAHI
jgi:hypothetical protein